MVALLYFCMYLFCKEFCCLGYFYFNIAKRKHIFDSSIKNIRNDCSLDSLNPVMLQLREMGLERNPFVVVSVIGQDLLSHGDAEAAIEVSLEITSNIMFA